MHTQTLNNDIVVEVEQEFPMPNNEVVKVVIPHSEVCMHMRVAGTIMWAELKAQTVHDDHGPRESFSVQLRNLDGSDYSFPITAGEAGFYFDAERHAYYCYKVVKIRQADERTCPECGARDVPRIHGVYSSYNECTVCGYRWNIIDATGIPVAH